MKPNNNLGGFIVYNAESSYEYALISLILMGMHISKIHISKSGEFSIIAKTDNEVFYSCYLMMEQSDYIVLN